MKKYSKRLLSCLLVLCLLLPVFSAAAYAGETGLKITVAADTHFQCEEDLGQLSDAYTGYMLDAETFGYASTQGQMNYESGAILSAMLDRFAASDSPILLIAGDLTCGKRASHLAFARFLKNTEDESGKRIFVINGNHDCDAESSEKGISMEEFREIYARFGYDEAVSRHEGSASYTADLDGRYRLLAVDTCIYGEDEGRITASVFRWIKDQVKQAKKDGRTLIAMMHHSLLPHYELQPMIDHWRFYAGWFADHRINTVLTGHIHANDISSSVTDLGNTVYDVQTGALISSPNTYRVLTFGDSGVDVESRFIDGIDVSLLPGMLTERQKDLLALDFPAYAREYFTEGVSKWLDRNVGSPDRLVRWFRLKEGTKAFDAAKKLTAGLGSAVGQDIYDSGQGRSVEETLGHFGVPVPPSGYKKPYEVAAKLMYGFFHGDEGTVSSASDVSLLLTCLEGAVLTAAKGLTDSESLGAFVFELTGRPLSQKALRLAAEKCALALLETLAGGIADDLSEPADLDVKLPAPQSKETVALHPLLSFFRLLAEFFGRLFSRG